MYRRWAFLHYKLHANLIICSLLLSLLSLIPEWWWVGVYSPNTLVGMYVPRQNKKWGLRSSSSVKIRGSGASSSAKVGVFGNWRCTTSGVARIFSVGGTKILSWQAPPPPPPRPKINLHLKRVLISWRNKLTSKPPPPPPNNKKKKKKKKGNHFCMDGQ